MKKENKKDTVGVEQIAFHKSHLGIILSESKSSLDFSSPFVLRKDVLLLQCLFPPSRRTQKVVGPGE